MRAKEVVQEGLEAKTMATMGMMTTITTKGRNTNDGTIVIVVEVPVPTVTIRKSLLVVGEVMKAVTEKERRAAKTAATGKTIIIHRRRYRYSAIGNNTKERNLASNV